MKIRINAFRISLATDKGPYGATAILGGGLNVIRAENTSGKTTLVNGILYALGLEILIGKRGIESTKPVLWNIGDYGGQEFKVAESYVELEAANELGEIVTIRRYVKGNKDPRLVEVAFGPVISGPREQEYQVRPFFVGVEGAAQREHGFHHFLAAFFNLSLPSVSRFKGDEVPLYVECIAPLMFIEQIRGWGSIQATLPQNFGIRNVAKLTVEHILGLDVIENEKRRIQVSEEAQGIRAEWVGLRSSLTQIASLVGGRAMNLPSNPVTSLPDEPWISIPLDTELKPLSQALIEKRRKVDEVSGRDELANSVGNSEVLAQLERLENQLQIAQAELNQVRSDLNSEQQESQRLRNRFEFLKSDIQRNKDIKRLRGYGLETGLSIAHDKCPTCNQRIQDSLVPTESLVMDVEDNIRFLDAELEAVEVLLATSSDRLAQLEAVKLARSEHVSSLRTRIRDLRADFRDNRPVSVAAVRFQIHLQEEIARLEKARDEFEALVARLRELAKLWENNKVKQAQLPGEYFSEQDKAKLDLLSQLFAANVRKFGYRSTEISDLHISPDNYRPVCDDFEVAFGASGSDNVRLIWAYTLALLQVSQLHKGNHWGILVFDEPEQQQMKMTSSDALYEAIAQLESAACQVIVATSAPEDITRRRLGNLPHHLLEFGDRVIRPLKLRDH